MKYLFTITFVISSFLILAQSPVKKITSGSEYSFLLREDGSLWAWGYNANSQLGTGNTDPQITAVKIGENEWSDVAVGAFHTLAIKTDGTLWAWGLNSVSQLGISNSTNQVTTPTQIGVATNWRKVYAGQAHSFGIKADSTLYGWGYNVRGQVGTGSTNTVGSPTQIGTEKWLSADAGGVHSLFIKSDSSLWSAGFNGNGQLGNGTLDDATELIEIDNTHNWLAVSAGFEFSCAIREDGKLFTWGYNGNGQLGANTGTDQNIPTELLPAVSFQTINMGSAYGLALTTDNKMYGWGFNGFGQLGITPNNAQTAMQLNDDSWSIVSCAEGALIDNLVSGNFSIGVKQGATGFCGAGSNAVGELGNDSGNSTFFNCASSFAHVSEESLENKIVLYPNPVEVGSTVNLGEKVETLTVYNVNMQVVATAKDVESIDTQNYLSGIYFVSLNNATQLLKLIVK